MVQKTFTAVPDPVNGMQGLIDRRQANREESQSRPPMTSKQARKMYNKKSGGKKLSAEEERKLRFQIQEDQRQRDAQDRKERKAGAVRAKKQEKEQKRIEEKKRKGLPLVDVRPSQDTITKFLRGNGSSKKRDSNGATLQLKAVREETPGTDCDTPIADTTTEKAEDKQAQLPIPEKVQEVDKTAPEETKPVPAKPFKRFRTGCTPRKEEKKVNTGGRSTIPLRKAEETKVTVSGPETKSQESSPEAQSSEGSIESEEEEYETDPTPTLSDKELFHEEHTDLVRELMDEEADTRRNKLHCYSLPVRDVYAAKRISPGKENEPPKAAVVKPEKLLPVKTDSNPVHTRPPTQGKPLEESSAYANSNTLPSKHAMAPPPLPPKSKPSIQGMGGGARPVSKPLHTPASRPLLRQATHSSARLNTDSPGSDMPSCTQLLDISMADLVDFLPSPSQEVRELGGTTSAPSLPPMPKLSVAKPQPPVWKPKPPAWKPPPPVWKPARPAPQSVVPKAMLPRAQVAPPADDMAFFLSTQDVTFSSQDIRELEDSTETPSRGQVKPPTGQMPKPVGPARYSRPSIPARNPNLPARVSPSIGNTGSRAESPVPVPNTRPTGPSANITPVNGLTRIASTKKVQGRSAISHAARYSRRSSQSGTPQPQSSVQSSAGFSHETPCRVGGVPIMRPASVQGSKQQGSISTPTAQAPPIHVVTANEQQPSSGTSVSPAKRYRQTTTSATPATQLTPAQATITTEPRPESPERSVSPPRKRFLTSSNVPIMLAEERSRKTFAEEQRKRELQEREAELLRRKEEEERQKQEAEDLGLLQEEADMAMMDDSVDDDLLLDRMLSQRIYAAISQGKMNKASTVNASQETDYGDLDFAWMTQGYVAASQGMKVCPAPGPGNDTQETDYGDLDLDAEDMEEFLEHVDFSDDDYP